MSVASEQQHNQDLKTIYKGTTNSRIHHFYQNALHSNCDLTFTTLALFLMQYVKVFKSGSIVVTSHFKLSMSFLSSLASVVEFLNQMKRNHRY